MLNFIDNILKENLVLKNALEDAKHQIEELRFQCEQLRRHQYGSRSERHVDEDRQMSLFDQYGEELPEFDEQIDDEKKSAVKSHTRREKRSQGFPDDLKRRTVIIKVPEEKRGCSCGLKKVFVKYEVTRKLHKVPAVYEVIEELREVVACPKKCPGEMTTAPKTPTILPRMRVTESFLADLIASKVIDRQPHYHTESQLKSRFGLDFTRQRMSRLFIDSAKPLQPLVNLLKDQIIGYDVASLDATTLLVLKEPGRKNTTKSYVYCFKGGKPGRESTVYEYNALQHKLFVRD